MSCTSPIHLLPRSRSQFVQAVSLTRMKGFLYYFAQLFSITIWCAMHIIQPPTPKVKVTILTNFLSGQFLSMLEWILILLHTIILHNKIDVTCSTTRHLLSRSVIIWAQTLLGFSNVSGLTSTRLNGF